MLKQQIKKEQIAQAGMELIDEGAEGTDTYEKEFDNLQKRCRELTIKYPAQAALFENFIQSQTHEYNALKNDIIGSIMVIKNTSTNNIPKDEKENCIE